MKTKMIGRMKKITRYLAAAAAAVLAIVSCNKNELGAPDGGKTRITIGARPEEAKESTKTYLSEESIPGGTIYHAKWSNSGEQLGAIFGTIDDKSKPITLSAEDTTDNDPIFTGNATLDDETYSLFLFYPRSAYEKCYAAGTVGINLKAVQHPVLGSFDPACDIMGWSTDDAVVENGSYTLEGITLTRPMAILRVNLNAPATGGKALEDGIGSVTGFKMEVAAGETSSENVVLTGRVPVSPTGGLGDKWNIENSYVEASIDAAEAITIGDNDGFQSIYLVVNPTTIPSGREITFSVETEKYSGVNKITRTVTAPADMAFEAGKVNTINLTLRDKDFPGSIIDENYNGDWLITGVKDENAVAALAYDGSGNNLKQVAITIEPTGSITSEADLTDALMTFTKVTEGEYAGLYTIQDANGKYLYAAASGSNHLKAKAAPDENAYWSVSYDSESDCHSIVATKSSNRNVMQYNSGSSIFACYASASQLPVKLYPASMISGLTTDPVITFEGAEPMVGSGSLMVTKTVSANATSVEFTYTKNKYVTELPTVGKWSYSGAWFVPDNGWEVTDGKVTVTLTPNTTEYIRDNQLRVYGQGFTDEARMYLLIKQEAYEAAPVLTIKSLNDQIRTDNVEAKANAKEYTGTIDNVIVTEVKGNYAFAEDATGGLLIYGVSGLSAGTTFSGDATFKAYMYNKMPEAIAFTQPATTGTASVIPCTTYTSIADLTSVWEERMSMRCVLKDVEVTAAFNNKNATVKDAAGNSLTVRDYAGSNLTLTVGDIVTLTGYPAQYNATKQFAVLDASDITVSSNPDTPTLSVSTTSLIWEANEYGESSAKQVTVTLNSGVDEDNYNIDGSSNDWVVTPYSGSANTVSVYPKAANTGSAAKTFTFKVVHGDDTTVYKEITCSQAMSAPITIADILAGGANTYAGTTDELLVYAVSGSNAIVGDSTGKMLLFKNGHGRAVGDIFTITNATVSLYNSNGNNVLEITDGTFTPKSSGNPVDHGTPADLDVSNVAQSNITAFSGTSSHSAVYAKMTGTQSGRNITNANNVVLYLSAANSATDGKSVSTTGYIYGYNSTKANFNYQMVSIEENINPDTPTLSVSATSLNWSATESGQSSAKQVTVTLNSSVDEDNYNIEGSSNDWVVTPYSGSANIVTVYPKAANTGSAAKTFTFRVVHGDDSSVYKEITCTQASANGGPSWTRVTSVSELLAGGTCILGYEATANSGVIVPMANTGSATTSAAGFMYSGSTAASGGSGTINMATVTETSSFEVTIVASTTVSGAICIKIGNNFIGNTDTKNNCKLFTAEAKTTSFTPTIGANDVFTLKITENKTYHTFQYNSGSPRFACYGGTQKNVVIYKKN